jgi:hypothetical protein
MVRSCSFSLFIAVVLCVNVSLANVSFSGTQYNAPVAGGVVSADLNRYSTAGVD